MVGEQTKPAGSIAAVVRLAVLAAVVGVVSAYASLGFLIGISWVQSLLVGPGAGRLVVGKPARLLDLVGVGFGRMVCLRIHVLGGHVAYVVLYIVCFC